MSEADATPTGEAVAAPPRSWSLADLRQTAFDEADRIGAVQTALVIAGMRHVPDPVEMARRERFYAIGRLIESVRVDPVLLERLRSGAMRVAMAPPAPVPSAAELAGTNRGDDDAG